MNKPITIPTLGRIVWYRGEDGISRAAIVVAAAGGLQVNLYVFGFSQDDPYACGLKERVTHADVEQDPGCLPSWDWMPFQKDQASKTTTFQISADKGQVELSNVTLHPERTSRAEIRQKALDAAMANALPGTKHNQVLDAARAYESYLLGEDLQLKAPGAAA